MAKIMRALHGGVTAELQRTGHLWLVTYAAGNPRNLGFKAVKDTQRVPNLQSASSWPVNCDLDATDNFVENSSGKQATAMGC
jgi:hypothetical protein